MSTWTLQTVKRYNQGRLPAPVISRTDDRSETLELLPCNPEKQALYPHFLGYLKRTHNGVMFQFPLEVHDGKLELKSRPKMDPQELVEAIQLLIDKAREEGHVFPQG